MKRISTFVVALFAVAMVGCKANFSPDLSKNPLTSREMVKHEPIPLKGFDKGDAQKIVRKAMLEQGWTPGSEKAVWPIVASLRTDAYRMTVEIERKDDALHVAYRSSRDLNYHELEGKQYINYRYNSKVGELAAAISDLIEMTHE